MNGKEEFIRSLVQIPPNSVGIELSTYCPLNCIYCDREKVVRKNLNLSLERFHQLKEKIKQFENVVLCGIGEPMSYPYIYEVVPILKQNVLIITSGSVEIDFKRLNRAGNIKVIIFSIDEPTEERMKQIASNYRWSTMLRNLMNVRKSGILVPMINCTVNKSNYKKIPEMIEFARRNDIKSINFTLDINEDNIPNFDSQELEEYIAYTKDKKFTKGLVITNSTSSLKCVTWNCILPYISVEGDVYPCCIGMKEEYLLGNIYEDNFPEIYKNTHYDEFRDCSFCFQCKLYDEYSV